MASNIENEGLSGIVQNDFFWGALTEDLAKKIREVKEHSTKSKARQRRLPRRKTRSVKKPYCRKNRAFRYTSQECCAKNCLQKNGGRSVMDIARNCFLSKTYDEQNLMLRSLIVIKKPTENEVEIVDETPSRRVRYDYQLIDDNAKNFKVCRTAFLKTFSISTKRIRVVINKIQPYTAALILDGRGKHHNQVKISADMKTTIRNYILENFKTEESHYSRATTNKRFLTPTVCKFRIWQQFLKDFEHIEGKPSVYNRGRKAPKNIISRKRFLEIVMQEFDFSFRKLRKDTCDTCDLYKNEISRSRSSTNKRRLDEEHDEHLKEANKRYLMHDYDFLILAKAKCDREWTIPPEWSPPKN